MNATRSIAVVSIMLLGLTSAGAAECRLTGPTKKLAVWKNEEALAKGEEIFRTGDSPVAAAPYIACIVDPGTRADIVSSTPRTRAIVTLDGPGAGCRGTVSINVCPTEERWGAIAYALTRRKVATSVVVNYPSKEKAEQAAMEKCNKQGVKGCTVAQAFTRCGYIATGRGPKGTTGFAVAWASSAEAASQGCLKRGAVRCGTPQGECNAEASQ